MPSGLIRRGARYSLRRRVPKDLVAHYGKAEIVFALNTSDPREARERLALEWVKLDADFRAIRSNNNLSQLSAQKSTGSLRGWPHYLSGEEFEDWERQQDEQAAEDAKEEAEYEARATLRKSLEDKLKRPSVGLTVEQEAFRDIILDERFRASINFERLAARSVRAEPSAVEPEIAAAQKSGPTLSQLVEPWASEQGVVAKGVADHGSVARWFEDRIGALPVADITRRHVIEFKDKLREEGQSQQNIKVKLSRLRTLLGYAMRNLHCSDNPAQGVTVQVKDAELRPPFDFASLKKLFGSPVYSRGERPAQGRGDAAYWLPLLALYTGARLEELGQLRASDVRIVSYADESDVESSVWCIHITANKADGLKLKNAGSDRLVPVHSILEACGFIRFANAAQSENRLRLFPELRPDKYGRFTAKWGEWFGTYRRDVCGIDPRIVFHSFRHTFKDNARHVGMAEGIQLQLMGHSAGDVAGRYGAGYSLYQLVEAMKSYRVPGFRPPPPAA